MKKLVFIIMFLIVASVASGQVYYVPAPIIMSVELVDGQIEVSYKRPISSLIIYGGDLSPAYEVWKDIYKAQITNLCSGTGTLEIVLWARQEGRYIGPKTTPESYEFDGELKLYGNGSTGGYLDLLISEEDSTGYYWKKPSMNNVILLENE